MEEGRGGEGGLVGVGEIGEDGASISSELTLKD